ncbi:hypothetical protein [Lysinibacillus sp. FJAT-14222]|uniref:hypothetical protein n=1 Tax=Lysinibacillus sp. FJAT-14222 TaxID=1932366 RepID=UPI00116088A6|nr:hypothetical protein [Lysinibacillus sp. FJAT-14222]
MTNIVLARDPARSAAEEAARRPPAGSLALCESEASATNVFCAKAKRQQQMFYLCESEASATNVLSVRKRSVSDKASSS